MIKPFDLRKSGVYALAGLIIGGLLLLAVFDYQSSVANITFYDFFKQSSTQNLLLALVLIVPVLGGVAVGRDRAQINELRGRVGKLTKDREQLIKAHDVRQVESLKLQELLDQESGLFVDNWDQLVTEKDKLREEAEVSSALLKAALAIGNLAGTEEVLNALAGALHEALFADSSLLFVWDPEVNAFVSDQEPDIQLTPRSFPAIKKLRDERVPVALDDVAIGGLIPKNIIEKLGIKSSILIPCVQRDEVVAIAQVIYTKAGYEFRDRDIQIASGIISPAKIVLENADLYQESIANHSELRRLHARLAESQEEERRRFSRDLHDGVIQNLSGIIFSLSFLSKALDPKAGGARQEIEQIEKIVQETITDLRIMINDLRPTILDSLGLVPTLEKHLERFGSNNNIAVIYKPQIKDRLEGAIETALFRLAQEALNNIKKHAKAKKVTLDLKRNNGSVVMCVKDDGLGFDVDEIRKRVSHDSGFGLSGMKERIQSLNGDVEITSRPGEGTLVKATIPLEAKGA
ncbi:MAG: GAF domain-containing sensor histidine kinase [Actinomycetota bacterium]|nr:GAF domain-containing sensor histidine kinase [Actinomycetota bacterium]